MSETAKKDILDFPLEEVEVPHAIGVIMQAASKCGSSISGDVDWQRLGQLTEKLEEYVQDKIEAAMAVRMEPSVEDDPNRFEDALAEDVHVVFRDGEPYQVVYKGLIYGKLCNTTVVPADNDSDGTYCIKQWNHQVEHQDMEGVFRV